jgi:hypothetical protein
MEIVSPDLAPDDQEEVVVPDPSDGSGLAVEPAADGAGPQSILDRVRAAAAGARENRTFDLPLPETVGGGLGLRLGVPRTAEVTIANDWADDVDVERDLGFLARHTERVIARSGDGESWEAVEDLSVQELALAYGTSLRGAAPVVRDDRDAVRELYLSGTPPQVDAQLVVTAARLYRLWAQDPTLGL